MNKRPSIASLAPRKAAAPEITQEPQIQHTNSSKLDASPSRPGKASPPYKSVLSKIDDAAHKQLKRLAVDEGVPVGDLQIEALNMLFKARGLPQIAVRVTPDEKGRKA